MEMKEKRTHFMHLLGHRHKLNNLIEKLFKKYAVACEYHIKEKDHPDRCQHDINTDEFGWNAFCNVENCPDKEKI